MRRMPNPEGRRWTLLLRGLQRLYAMSEKIIENLRDILTVKKLAKEVALSFKQLEKIERTCDIYLNALLGIEEKID
jgi:hypothetical protein